MSNIDKFDEKDNIYDDITNYSFNSNYSNLFTYVSLWVKISCNFKMYLNMAMSVKWKEKKGLSSKWHLNCLLGNWLINQQFRRILNCLMKVSQQYY